MHDVNKDPQGQSALVLCMGGLVNSLPGDNGFHLWTTGHSTCHHTEAYGRLSTVGTVVIPSC